MAVLYLAFVALTCFASLNTVSAIWPIPQQYSQGTAKLCLDPSFFIRIDVQPLRSVPADLREAVKRIRGNIVSSKQVPVSLPVDTDEAPGSIMVPADGTPATLVANTTLGLLRGLTTFEQLWHMGSPEYTSPYLRQAGSAIPLIASYIPFPLMSLLPASLDLRLPTHYTPSAPYQIIDRPAYPWRGLLVDTSRNYFPLSVLRDLMDAMSFVKLNVFHWHITDSHSWPLSLKALPELAEKGAYSSDEVYTEADVDGLVAYAAERGIDVLLEIDLPGHTASIGVSHPDLIACGGRTPWTEYANEPPAGQLRFTLPEAQDLVSDLLESVAGLADSSYFGLGGDEINMKCYAEDSRTTVALALGNQSFTEALDNFVFMMDRAIGSKTPVMWQEMMLSHGLSTVSRDTIALAWQTESDKLALLKKGHRIIDVPSNVFYLDCGGGSWVSDSPTGRSWCDPYKPWELIHSYDPVKNVPAHLKDLVLGGEAVLWTEQTDEQNLDAKLWPRAAAAAEVFWTGNKGPNAEKSRERMNDLRARLVSKGVRAAALQPKWCIRNPGRC